MWMMMRTSKLKSEFRILNLLKSSETRNATKSFFASMSPQQHCCCLFNCCTMPNPLHINTSEANPHPHPFSFHVNNVGHQLGNLFCPSTASDAALDEVHTHNNAIEELQQPLAVSPCRFKKGILHGTLDPDGSVDEVFYDASEYGDESKDTFRVEYQRESIVLSRIVSLIPRGGALMSQESCNLRLSASLLQAAYSDSNCDNNEEVKAKVEENYWDKLPPPPPAPEELPLRFLRAGKGDPTEGLRRYEDTLAWRKEHKVDTILREGNLNFDLIKEQYPHYCHGKGRCGEPCYYEIPPRTDLKALREGGVTLDSLLRHYTMVTEYQWQVLVRDDLQHSIYIIDLEGIGLQDFVGEVVDFVKKAGAISGAHYPERAGYVFGKKKNSRVSFSSMFSCSLSLLLSQYEYLRILSH
jgi:hypothetical protein